MTDEVRQEDFEATIGAWAALREAPAGPGGKTHVLERCFARHASPLRTRIAELEGAAVAFLAKLDECQPHIDDAFVHRQLRCGAYDGPQYGEELAALRATLNGEKKHG